MGASEKAETDCVSAIWINRSRNGTGVQMFCFLLNPLDWLLTAGWRSSAFFGGMEPLVEADALARTPNELRGATRRLTSHIKRAYSGALNHTLPPRVRGLEKGIGATGITNSSGVIDSFSSSMTCAPVSLEEGGSEQRWLRLT